MRNTILLIIFSVANTCITLKSHAQTYANTSLSNLKSPTSINTNLVPDKNTSRNLGSLSKSWKNLYLDSAIYIDSVRFIAFRTGSGDGNTAIGKDVLYSDISGSSNTAIGYKSLYYNQSGSYNTAMGRGALYQNVVGEENTSIGYRSLYSNFSGSDNTAIGENTLYSNYNGYDNTAIGNKALFSNVTGYNNIAVGANALYNNTGGNLGEITGTDNVAIGIQALYKNSDGRGNTTIGNQSLYYNTTGDLNIAMGYQALYQNTTGSTNIAIGDYALSNNKTLNDIIAIGYDALGNLKGGSGRCIAIGIEAGLYNTTGSYNEYFGPYAGTSNTTGNNNIYVGNDAGFNNKTGNANVFVGNSAGLYSEGSNNTYLGHHAGNTVTTGSSNTIIGYGADVGNAGYSNATAIGNLAVVGGSNHVRIGNSSVTIIGGQVSWSTLSDARVKNNIQQNVPGLQFINLLKPVTYHYDVNKQDNLLGKKTEDWNGKYDIEKTQFTGFVAQDIEAAAKKIGYDFSGVDIPKNDKDLYSLRYSDFVVPIVKAVQELSAQNDSLKDEIKNIKSEMEELKSLIVSNRLTTNSQQSTAISSASLQQNIPNPFSNSTTINYSLPQHYSSAKIIITGKNGNALKTITLSNNKGSINIDAATLSSGAYQYSLYVDGKLVASKQMEHLN